MEILAKGDNGRYGLLRKLDSGRYAVNFILFDKAAFEEATAIYLKKLPEITGKIISYTTAHKPDYQAFPYLNKKTTFNLILWQQIYVLTHAYPAAVESILQEKYFPQTSPDRPFTVFGHERGKNSYSGGWSSTSADNICGYTKVRFDNIYTTKNKKHFSCTHNISTDPTLQLALRAVNGIKVETLTEEEKEHAAKAIDCGYLYREDDTIYTKILVHSMTDNDRIFTISEALKDEYLTTTPAAVNESANEIAALIKKNVPAHLLGEWRQANTLSALPLLEAAVNELIKTNYLTPPESSIGAEGCFMSVRSGNPESGNPDR